MKVGLVGLGRMGEAVAYRLLKDGHKVVAFDPDSTMASKVKRLGARITKKLEDVAKETNMIWLMVPAGEIIDEVIKELLSDLKEGTILIDGGNSNFKDTIKRSRMLKKYGIHFLDCGTSGGLHGRKIGFSLMVGGGKKAFKKLYPILKSVAMPNGFSYMGPSGTGHYVKMVHNGIEYALLQSYAEGFNLLKNGHYKKLDLKEIAKVWLEGSIIRSWILELTLDIFSEDRELKNISGEIGENLTGRWTVEEAKKQKLSIDLIDKAVAIRARSRRTGGNYATKIVAMLRNKFGGHPVIKARKKNVIKNN